jgi:hypothetical protein
VHSPKNFHGSAIIFFGAIPEGVAEERAPIWILARRLQVTRWELALEPKVNRLRRLAPGPSFFLTLPPPIVRFITQRSWYRCGHRFSPDCRATARLLMFDPRCALMIRATRGVVAEVWRSGT